ncbi:stage V sporulation protein AC [Anaerobacillus isosaccharinicus]|uniref:Stage V sporulation protein AC n=1 Tax=Anaerobacillus isosaccharinicus TaxID=1532552 RepID=A0A1S2M3Q0_9BACI|nr:stage V sporulation protein AC [Anaerobacillus isosaccharinicus]MBA5585747.1 stage V sporulation protein AC [Anaerobacillus isosaccharinicus]QOY35952.1 stage V sporulation protein AC [Anaerobacillus isosaccharinicus]
MDQKQLEKNKKKYKKVIEPFQPKPQYIKNCIKAFLVGGLICAIGQGLANFYIYYLDLTEKTVASAMIGTLIFIAALLTAFGVYDKIGQFAGAGSLGTVAGFSNAIASSALEHKSEGVVLGIAGNMFKIAGAVIVFGVVSAYIVSMIRLLVQTLIS